MVSARQFPFSQLIFASLLVGMNLNTALAQSSQTLSTADCAKVAGGNATDSTVRVICGMPTEQVVALLQALSTPDPEAKAEAIELLRARLPGETQFRMQAIAKFFEILGQEQVPPEKLADKFAQIAEENLRLHRQLQAAAANQAEISALVEQAAAALEPDKLHIARRHLEAAQQFSTINQITD